jgi:hypothetical protein
MAKRMFIIIIAVVAAFLPAQGQTIGLKLGMGTGYNNWEPHSQTERIELNFGYPILNRLSAVISTGYIRRHFPEESSIYNSIYGPATDISPEVTLHFIPITAGLHYILLDRPFSPYVSLEYGRIFNVSTSRYGGGQNDAMAKIGVGTLYKITDRVMLDASIKYESQFRVGWEFMIGISVQL